MRGSQSVRSLWVPTCRSAKATSEKESSTLFDFSSKSRCMASLFPNSIFLKNCGTDFVWSIWQSSGIDTKTYSAFAVFIWYTPSLSVATTLLPSLTTTPWRGCPSTVTRPTRFMPLSGFMLSSSPAGLLRTAIFSSPHDVPKNSRAMRATKLIVLKRLFMMLCYVL